MAVATIEDSKRTIHIGRMDTKPYNIILAERQRSIMERYQNKENNPTLFKRIQGESLKNKRIIRGPECTRLMEGEGETEDRRDRGINIDITNSTPNTR